MLSLASVVVLMLGLLAAEGLLRAADPGYFERRPASLDTLHRYSEVYGWDLRPGARRQEDDHWVSINASGHRGLDISGPPGSGRARVVLLGDSITFGTYVGDGETFADHLGRAPGFEVVNLGVQGYGPGQSLLKLEREGLRYAPQVVVLNVCLANDFADIMLPTFLYDARHPKPYFKLEQGRLVLHDEHLQLGPMERAGRLLHERSLLYNRARDLLARRAPDGPVEGAWVARRNQALRDERAVRALAVALVARLRERAEAAGAALVVALHPDKQAFKHGSDWPATFAAAPELAGVELIDMGREYRRSRLRGRDLLLDAIGHLSPEGHQRAAAIMLARLGGLRPALVRGSRSVAPPRG